MDSGISVKGTPTSAVKGIPYFKKPLLGLIILAEKRRLGETLQRFNHKSITINNFKSKVPQNKMVELYLRCLLLLALSAL